MAPSTPDAARQSWTVASEPTATMLAEALLCGDIRTEFQPKIRLATGALIGVEALSRWTDAQHGAIPPEVFIRLAERCGLISRLTQCVLRDSLLAVTALRRHHPEATVAVNIAPATLDDPGLPSEIAGLLEAAGLPPAALVVEITEGQPFANPDRAAEVLTALCAYGVGCAMDDFGIGYATLPSLLRLPFTELKIDRSFVGRMADLPEALKLVRATIGLGHSLGLTVVAEGIETAEVAALLCEAGCDVGQGFLYGRAMAIQDVLARWPDAAARP